MLIKLWHYITSLPFPAEQNRLQSHSYSSVILGLNAVICFYLAYILGLNYSPVNDGWIHYVGVDLGAYELEKYVDRVLGLNINSRFFAKVPYLVSSVINDDGFMTGKVILLSLNIVTGWGLYLFLSYIFPLKRIFAAICALFYFYFSFDGSMFWFGAWGINIGLCAMVFSMYFFLQALDEKSKLKLFWACLLIAICFLCYPGPITWFLFVFCLIAFFWIKSLRSRFLYFFAYVMAYGLANILFVSDALTADGRAGTVASFEAATGISNSADMLNGLLVQTPISLLKPDPAHIIPALIIAILSFMAFRFIAKDRQSADHPSEESLSLQDLLVFSLIGFGLIVAGMMPYVFTTVEMDGQRALIYARSGYVLIFVSLFAFGIGQIFKLPTTYNTALSGFGAALMFLVLQDKAVIAQNFHADSLQTRKFLSHLVEAVPNYEPGSHFLFYIDPASLDRKPGMLINRPHAPVRYLYSDHSPFVLTVTPFQLKSGRVKIEDNHVMLRDKKVDLKQLISLQYDEDSGFTPLTEITVSKTGLVALPGNQRIRKGVLSERKKWFLENRD